MPATLGLPGALWVDVRRVGAGRGAIGPARMHAYMVFGLSHFLRLLRRLIAIMNTASIEDGPGRGRARTGGFSAVMSSGPPVVDPLVPLSVRVPASLRKRLRVSCLQHDRSVQEVVAEALETWLEQNEPNR